MPKAKQSPPSNDGLGITKHIADMLKSEDILIIMDSLDPIKLIVADIRYQRLLAKIYGQKSGGE